MTATLSTALVGAGAWGRNVLRALHATPTIDLRLVVDPSLAARQRAQTIAPNVPMVEDLQRALEDSTIEAIVLATPALTHAELTIAALQAGKHVFVEKPLCMSNAEGERIRHAAAISAQKIMVGHLMLYHPAVQKLRDVVHSGELGTLRYLYATRVNLGTVRREENAWWSLAPHDLSMILDLVGTMPERISVYGAAYLTPGVEDVVFAHLVFPGGIVASIHVSWLDPHKRRELTVVGDRKMVTFDDVQPGEKLRIYDKGAELKSEFTSFAEFVALRHGDVSIPRLDAIEPLKVEIEHFAAAMLTGSEPRTSLASGLDVVRILEAGQKSLGSGGLPVVLR